MVVRRILGSLAMLTASTWSATALAQETPPTGSWAHSPPTSSAAPALPLPATRTLYLSEQPGAPAPMAAGQSAVMMPSADCCNQPTCGAKQCPPIFTPFMLGDFTGPIANLFTDVKIAEGESPMPMDRVFLKSNYYNNLNKSRWTDPTEPIHNVDLYRFTFGFEKTFFNQSVSLGLRVPFNTINADGKPVHLAPDPITGQLLPSFSDEGFDTTLFGNVSAIAKAVLWEDRPAGNVISAGVTTSLPTASNVKIDP